MRSNHPLELPASDAGQVHQKAKGHLEVLTFRFRLRENIFEITTAHEREKAAQTPFAGAVHLTSII